MTELALNIRNVVKRFQRRSPTLNGITLSVPVGGAVEVIGANGSGKSTLLRIASGFTLATSGSVHRGNMPSAVVPSSFRAAPGDTGYSYLWRHGRLQGIPRSKLRTRIEYLTAIVPITPLVECAVNTLSLGNTQRLLLLQAFLNPGAIVFCDEPLIGLDDSGSEEFHRLASAHLAVQGSLLITSPEATRARISQSYTLSKGRLEPTQSVKNSSEQVHLVVLDCDVDIERQICLALRMIQFPVRSATGNLHVQLPSAQLPALLSLALEKHARVVSVQPATDDSI